MRGTLVAGLIASLAAIAAYFHLLGGLSDPFLLYGRARGTFNDPNVLGRLSGAAGADGVSAHAGGTALGRAWRRRHPAGDAHRAPSFLLARRLGPVRRRGAAAHGHDVRNKPRAE